MPRIPDAELERLKTEVSLVRLIESQGHQCCVPRFHRISSQIAITRFQQD
jgi:hypothetical protein